MRTLTIKEVAKAKDDLSIVMLASFASPEKTRKLEYDYHFKAYTIHTENGTMTTDKIKEAVHRYNTADMTLGEYNGS